MENKQKTAYAKSIDSEKKTVSGYVSTFEWDRVDEKFAKGAWDLKNYLANPVVLFAHNGRDFPIGRNVDIGEDSIGLKAVTEFDSKSEDAMRVFDLYARQFLNAFSVGFAPKTFVLEPLPDGQRKGLVWTNAELYEYSAVTVPANAGALVTRDLAEMVIKTLGEDYIEVVPTKTTGDQFFVVPPDARAKKGAAIDKDAGLEDSLKGIILLAKAAKGMKVPEQTKSLILTTQGVFNEILAESKDQISEEDLRKLGEAVKEWGSVIGNLYPQCKEKMDVTISQLGKSLEGRAA